MTPSDDTVYYLYPSVLLCWCCYFNRVWSSFWVTCGLPNPSILFRIDDVVKPFSLPRRHMRPVLIPDFRVWGWWTSEQQFLPNKIYCTLKVSRGFWTYYPKVKIYSMNILIPKISWDILLQMSLLVYHSIILKKCNISYFSWPFYKMISSFI